MACPSRPLLLAFLCVALLLSFTGTPVRSAKSGVTCRDENGDPVDWWVIFKVPHLKQSSNPAAGSGYGYAYADSSSQELEMTANQLDTNLKGALGATLGQLYGAAADQVGWVMYNDETTDNKQHEGYGHTKGDMGFDSKGGFWLVHSVPRFPDAAESEGSYTGYPAYASTYGQSFLCVSMDLDNLDNAASAFLLNKPYIYSSNLPSGLEMPNLEAVINNQFVTEAAVNSTTIKSNEGTAFMVFSKTGAWNQDLYSELVSPTIGSDLVIETWMNGAVSNRMPSFCRPSMSYDNINVKVLSFSDDISWKETQDHSKWALGVKRSSIVCIGDINRQYSQAKRGGGTVCMQSPTLWTSINALITDTEACTSRR